MFTASCWDPPDLEFQPDMTHTELQIRYRDGGEMTYELESSTGIHSTSGQ
jgi:hypothetical protein